MKTPEEIKKGLECAVDKKCIGKECSYFNEEYACIRMVQVDALALIQQLEAENVKLERERDAAIHDLQKARECRTCTHANAKPSEQPCISCGICGRNYVWRGPFEENTENP